MDQSEFSNGSTNEKLRLSPGKFFKHFLEKKNTREKLFFVHTSYYAEFDGGGQACVGGDHTVVAWVVMVSI